MTVMDLSSSPQSLSITLTNATSVSVTLASATCSDDSSTYSSYTYSTLHTPSIPSIDRTSLSPGDEVVITVTGISNTAQENVLTIGNRPCISSSHSSINESQPDYSYAIPSSQSFVDAQVTCQVADLYPGSYRIALHVAGHGWAYASDDVASVLLRPTVTDQVVPAVGSLRGGQLLSVPVRGLPTRAVSNTAVSVGHTPCFMQAIELTGASEPWSGNLTCVTQSAQSDGYSSLIEQHSPLAYWSLQSDFFSSDGSHIGTDGVTSFSNQIELGIVADATIVGEVSRRQVGISGNSLTDQAAKFDSSYLHIPSIEGFSFASGFGLELWLKNASENGTYQTVAGSIESGFLLLINPCQQLEFWLFVTDDAAMLSGSGSGNGSSNGDTNVANANSNVNCFSNEEVKTVSDDSVLPSGVWSVVRHTSNLTASLWYQVFIGFRAENCSSDQTWCSNGTQSLHVNGNLVHSRTTAFSPPVSSSLEIGGTSKVEESSPVELSAFVGWLDEVSIYEAPLTPEEIGLHYHFGSTEAQPVWVITESADTSGDASGLHGEAVIDWETASGNTFSFNDSTLLKFEWNR